MARQEEESRVLLGESVYNHYRRPFNDLLYRT